MAFAVAAPRAGRYHHVVMIAALLSVLAVPARADDAPRIPVAVMLYDGALLLDYGIAAEMFLAADYMRAFHVYTVAAEPTVELSIVGSVAVDYTFGDCPPPRVVIVPGGPLWSRAGEDSAIVAFLRSAQDGGATLYSICTGAMLLGKAGLLDGRNVTTNHQAVPMLRTLVPSAHVDAEARFVDDGNLVTAAGSGTAIEATLHLIERLSSRGVAEHLAHQYMNYPHYP